MSTLQSCVFVVVVFLITLKCKRNRMFLKLNINLCNCSFLPVSRAGLYIVTGIIVQLYSSKNLLIAWGMN